MKREAGRGMEGRRDHTRSICLPRKGKQLHLPRKAAPTGALHLHGLFPGCHTSWRLLPPAANSHQSSRVSLNAIAS